MEPMSHFVNDLRSPIQRSDRFAVSLGVFFLFFVASGVVLGQAQSAAPSKGHVTDDEVLAFTMPGHEAETVPRSAYRSVAPRTTKSQMERKVSLRRSRETVKSGVPTKAGPVYTSAQLAGMTTPNLIEAVSTTDYDGIRALWSFDGDVGTVISESNVDAFVTQILSEKSDLSGNALRIYQKLVFLHICGFHEFWEASVDYSNSMHTTVDNTMAAIAAEGDFLTDGSSLALLRQEWCVAADVWESLLAVLDTLDALLQRYNGDASYQTDYDETFTIYYLFNGVTRDMWNNTVKWKNELSATFIAETGDIATDTNMDPDANYLVGWALFTLGLMGNLDNATASSGHQLLSDAYAVHPPYELNWLLTVQNLESYHGATLFDTTALDVAQIRLDVEAIAFPFQYFLDGGNLIFFTPLSEADVNDLYDAVQEVESQFHRLSTFLDPVPGDTNDVLTMRIYGSRTDYETYQFFLYGLGTNNGGIYIESQGTFYTYDRTPQESIYTLEELTRHEYVHYLQSRFSIEGSWGVPGTLYDNNRMVWWEEGYAEFIAGSTRDLGVLPRRTLVQQVGGDATRLSIDDLVGSTYNDGFKFYRYGGTFFDFLYEHSTSTYATISDLINVIRSNNATAVDAAFAAIEADVQLQNDFTQYLDQLVLDEAADARAFWDDVPTAHVSGVAGSNSNAIRQEIENRVPTVSPSMATTGDRFVFSDTVSFADGSPSPNETSARLTWESFLDQLLDELETVSENFIPATAWFGDLVPAGNTLTATYFVEGPYSNSSTLTVEEFRLANIPAAHAVDEPIAVAVDATTNLGTVIPNFAGNVSAYAHRGLGARELAVGNGTVMWTHPFNTNAHENRTQVIYTAAEIGESGTLERLALDVSVLPDRVMNNWTVRLQHTALNSYPTNGSAQWVDTGWTTVLQEDATVSSLGLVWFEFDTPFVYNGVDNLLVDFSFDNSSYGNRGYGDLFVAGATRVLSAYTYGEYGSPLTWTGSTPTPEPTSYVPNIIFSGGKVLSISPGTMSFDNGSWAGEITIHEPGAAVIVFVDDGQGHTGTSNVFSVTGSSSAAMPAANTIGRLLLKILLVSSGVIFASRLRRP
jgi:hypothetical protein